jgi:hypothetical protein
MPDLDQHSQLIQDTITEAKAIGLLADETIDAMVWNKLTPLGVERSADNELAVAKLISPKLGMSTAAKHGEPITASSTNT